MTKQQSISVVLGVWAAAMGPAMASASGPADDEQAANVAQSSETTSVHYSAETSLASTYVFRGVPQYLSKTDPSSQTSLSLTLDSVGPGAISVGLWNATALDDFGSHGGTQLEFDVTAGYSMPLSEKLTGSLGYIGYFYPEGDPVDGAHEIAAVFSYATDIVTPSVGVFAEFVRLDGAYVSLAASRDFALPGAITVTPGASLGLSRYSGIDAGLNDIDVMVAARRDLPGGLYLGSAAHYAYSGLDGMGDTGNRSTVWGSLYMGYAR